MDWTMVGAFGELAGAAVVAITLIYLARQVSLSNRLAQAEAWRVLNTTNAGIGLTAAAIPEFRTALTRALDNGACRKDLGREEALTLSLFYDSLLNIYQQAFRDVSLGSLPERALQDVSSQLLALPYFEDAWPLLRGEYAQDFVTFVETRHGVGQA